MAKSKDLERIDRTRTVYEALSMRRQGWPFTDVARRLNITVTEAVEYARAGYAQMIEETGDEVRAAVEDRIDNIVRIAHEDLRIAQSQSERTALLRLLLAAEAQRARLLGVNIPSGTPDEGGESDG
ncbi:hypothetical protein ACFM35_05010 [Microbacterium sp. P01]|uniref:hypothetical protein n=1 Tax=Microbacterium sp. P01 TaxID=3366261 RepID=UPI00366D4B54